MKPLKGSLLAKPDLLGVVGQPKWRVRARSELTLNLSDVLLDVLLGIAEHASPGLPIIGKGFSQASCGSALVLALCILAVAG